MIVYSLLRYGWHGVDALRVCAETIGKELSWKQYVADLICLGVRPKYSAEIPFFEYVIKKSKVDISKETAEEIIQRLINSLTG